jgi:acyl-homoserine lactone acylase PvdQ
MYSANFKQIMQYGNTADEDYIYMSLDTGQSGNLFSRHYFNLNADHNRGKLVKVSKSIETLEKTDGNQVIYIKPVQNKKQDALNKEDKIKKDL